MKKSRWFDLIEFPPGTAIVSAQELIDFYAQHPREFWDVAADFRHLAPPRRSLFLQGRAPEWLLSERVGLQRWPPDRPPAWGIHFAATDIRCEWQGKHTVFVVDINNPGEPDEFVIDGGELKSYARWEVVGSLVESVPIGDRWAVSTTAKWRYLVGDDGAIPQARGHHFFGSKDRDADSTFLAGARMPLLFPMLLAVSAWNEGAVGLTRRHLARGYALKLRPGRVPSLGPDQQDQVAS